MTSFMAYVKNCLLYTSTVNDLVSICLGIRKKLGESFGHMLISTVMVDTERNRHFRKFLEFNQFRIFLAFSHRFKKLDININPI